MSYRKSIGAVTAAMALVGIIVAAVPFVGALNPTAREFAALPRIDISSLAPGDVLIMRSPQNSMSWSRYEWRLVIYAREDGVIKAWNMLGQGPGVMLPDLRIIRPYVRCLEFGPVRTPSGAVDHSQPLICHDYDGFEHVEYWEEYWRWDHDGKAIHPSVDDLPEVAVTREGDFLVIGAQAN